MMGEAVVPSADVIDCDAAPFLPHASWKVVEHKPRGQLIFDPTRFDLFLSPTQKSIGRVRGDVLRRELENAPTENANVLDYYMLHPQLYLEAWKKKHGSTSLCICFWGTLFADTHGVLYVRYMYFATGRLQASYSKLEHTFYVGDPALIRVT